MIKLTDQQWADLVTILSSYKADLEQMGDINPEYIDFIEAIVDEIGDQDAFDTEIEFELEETLIDLGQPDDD